MKKKFSLGTILTVTTGRLLTEPKSADDNGIGDLYKLLDHMTNDSNFTHQLGRVLEECKPYLLKWFPELNSEELNRDVIEFCDNGKPEIKDLTDYLVSKGLCKSEYEVDTINNSHVSINPIKELKDMMSK